MVVRWVLPEADDSHAEAACHEVEAVSLPDVGLGHSSRGKASGRAQQHELTDVQPGLTYEVHKPIKPIPDDSATEDWIKAETGTVAVCQLLST